MNAPVETAFNEGRFGTTIFTMKQNMNFTKTSPIPCSAIDFFHVNGELHHHEHVTQ
jgi:hypothetical protein